MPNLNVKPELHTWLKSLTGGRRGDSIEEVLDSVLRTAQGRMEALATYQGKTAKPAAKTKAKKAAKPAKAKAKKAAPAKAKASTAKTRKVKADTEGKRVKPPEEVMAAE